MNRETRDKYTVNGFLFGDELDIELASQEYSAIQYIDKKIENRSGETIFGVYEGALEKRMFRTPVGYCYLHSLQKRMLKSGIRKERITPIPLYQVFNDSYKTEERPRKISVHKKKKKPNEKILLYSLLANILLAVLVAALFAIAMKGETPNALNYRHSIENEYAAWEEELEEREQTVREKERALNMTDDD